MTYDIGLKQYRLKRRSQYVIETDQLCLMNVLNAVPV